MPHERLLLKFKCHEIDGSLLLWLRSLLIDRKRVVVRGTHILVSWNVRGSPRYDLGLTFISNLRQWYIIYRNISSTLRMFTDDTKVYRQLSNIARDSEALQLNVDQLLSWASKWQLCFNPDKSEVLRITHKRDLPLPTYLQGTSLKSVKHVKDLGIFLFLQIYPGANRLTWPLIRLTNFWIWFTEQWARPVFWESATVCSLVDKVAVWQIIFRFLLYYDLYFVRFP